MESSPQAAGPRAGLPGALARARELLPERPDLAEAQALEILRAVPGHPEALWVTGAARRRRGDVTGALSILRPLAAGQPRAAVVHLELGRALAAAGETHAARRALEISLRLNPRQPEAWRALGDLLTAAGAGSEADAAYAESLRASTSDPALLEAAAALSRDDIATAERLLRARLRAAPDDLAALRMLAEAGTRLGRYVDAEALLERCLEIAPGNLPARHNLAVALFRQNRGAEALVHIARLLEADPEDPGYRNLKAAALGLVGDYEQAIALYEDVLAARPGEPRVWLSYGHALRTAGRTEEAVRAYRRAVALRPDYGEAYWSLANLKTFRFEAEEARGMEAALAREDVSPQDRLHLAYALGKAREDAGAAEAAFALYASGAKIRKSLVPYDADETSALVERARRLFTPEFFEARRGWGRPEADPIFVVGLPRSGSTLVEQILASHSAVEGTMELPEIAALARELRGLEPASEGSAPDRYPDALGRLDEAEARRLGSLYLERTRIHRRQGRPFFVDKMPNNFVHIGLIQLILPNATIIDARRHPMATCFSAFKQHFARGQNFSYDLEDVGRYWLDYAQLMEVYAAALPGRVHRVIYEHMVTDTQAEVEKLLQACGLPFEDACLRFYETERAVRTASSEQVRRPIFREGLDQWRRFEAQLEPLRRILGPAAEAYPNAPPS